MAACILIVALLAIVAPLLHRAVRGATHWVLGIAAGAIAVWLAGHFPALADGRPIRETYPWVPALDVSFAVHADGLGLLLAVVVTGIGALILIYSGGYLRGHAQLGAFYAYLLFFMASMLGVALADNVILLFIFWELTSFSSYLLIGFEHERREARSAALQALLVTGAGGLALLAGLVLMGSAGGSMELSSLFDRGEAIRAHGQYGVILLLVLLGATTKSAQFPFHFWLPNAMEAPSPVSAYLHSATMVKAGVFLLARLTPILGSTASWSISLITIGAITMLLGAWLSFTSRNLKRILAYSTVSVLGTLTMLLGVGTPAAVQAAMIYLIAHALYKGALFMLAGALIHATDESEAERLSGLARAMPITALAALLAAASMAGLPPFFAFVSKEALYESLLHAESLAALLVAAAVAAHILLLVVAIRTGVRPFFGRKLNTPSTPHEVAPSMWLGPLTTGLLALVAAYFVAAIGVQVVEPAVTAILGSTAEPAPTLALWHGVKLALGLSVITLAAGIVVFAMRARILTRFTHVRWPHWLRAPGAYDAALDGLNTLAQAQTRVLQSGYLRRYLLIVLLTTAALVVPRLVLTHGLFAGLNATDVRLHELVVAGLVLLGAVVAVRSRSRLGAVAALGTVGYGVALLFVFFGAPDLAMTQFLIETLLVILFVLVFYHLPSFTVFSPRWVRAVDGSVAIAFGAMMSCLTLLAMESPAASYVSQYFAQRSVSDAHGRNVVNVILVDFRAIDTLGEVTVLAVAAIGVLALVRLRPRSRTPIGASQRAGTAPAGPPEFGQPPPGGPQ